MAQKTNSNSSLPRKSVPWLFIVQTRERQGDAKTPCGNSLASLARFNYSGYSRSVRLVGSVGRRSRIVEGPVSFVLAKRGSVGRGVRKFCHFWLFRAKGTVSG